MMITVKPLLLIQYLYARKSKFGLVTRCKMLSNI